MAGSVGEAEMVDAGVALGFWLGWGWDWDWALDSEFEIEFEVEVGGVELGRGV